MAISNTNSKVVYLCDGTTTEFPYPFKIFDKTHLKVIKYYIPSGEETELVLDTDYSVSGVGDDSGGTVTLLISPPDSNYKLIIMRNVPLTQEVDYRENDPFPVETLEQALDKLTMISQQLQEQVGRAVLQDPTQSQQVVIPTPPGENKVLTSPSAGQIQWSKGTSVFYAGDISYGKDADKNDAPTKGDVYYATDTGIMYVCYDSGTWTAYHQEGSGKGLVADKVDGYDASTTPQANTIPVANGDGSIKDWITDQEILDKLKNVDGSGSGLDADLLRGLPADFTCSKSTNGYTKLPNGLILQWGKRPNEDAYEGTITFPISFPNSVLTIQLTPLEPAGNNMISVVSYENSSFYWRSRTHDNSLENTGLFWLAIGY